VISSAVLAPVARFTDEEEYLKLSYNLLQGPGYSMDGVHLNRLPAAWLCLFSCWNPSHGRQLF